MARKQNPALHELDENLTFRPETRAIDNLVSLYERKRLNLSPGFQRKSVWSKKDRENLIDSILRNYPLPSIFLYKRIDERTGDMIFDVVDGKQRIETVLMYMGKMGKRYLFDTPFDTDDGKRMRLSWRELQKSRQQSKLEYYKVNTIEVEGDIHEIISLFVRINSTGKALTGAEKRNARYSTSIFLKTASRMARKFEPYFRSQRIVNENQASRMKHVELMCELLLASVQGEVTDRKAALDKVMSADIIRGTVLKRAEQSVTRALNRIKRMFPKLRETRLRQASDFYSLAVLIEQYEREGLILTNSARNQNAWNAMRHSADSVDAVALNIKKGKRVSATMEQFRNYHATVTRSTDKKEQRELRQSILDALIRPIFDAKDPRRGFTAEQRRRIWNKTKKKQCAVCGERLDWDTFTIDHVVPHSKGGRTSLANAVLLCAKHNSMKGNRKSLQETRKSVVQR